ncbi:hypothetical protein [Providencia sp. PROV212]|uniref:hypothetical protein n=1 Tax=Providencia sp. PROV212 TaxID=2949909 RepID=UPI002349E77A|nr:hypothetical protein [Providencia sp. PROV212]
MRSGQNCPVGIAMLIALWHCQPVMNLQFQCLLISRQPIIVSVQASSIGKLVLSFSACDTL